MIVMSACLFQRSNRTVNKGSARK